MGRAYRCEHCDDVPEWRIERIGDAVVTWACSLDLVTVCRLLQRAHERTQLTVTVAVIP